MKFRLSEAEAVLDSQGVDPPGGWLQCRANDPCARGLVVAPGNDLESAKPPNHSRQIRFDIARNNEVDHVNRSCMIDVLFIVRTKMADCHGIRKILEVLT